MALEVMAKTGAVELQTRAPGEFPGELLASEAECKAGLDEFLGLAHQYGPYWPAVKHHPAPLPASPRQTVARALTRIRAWREQAFPLIQRLQRLESERAELRLWRRLSLQWQDSTLDFRQLAEAGPALSVSVALLPKQAEVELPAGVLVQHCPLDDPRCLLMVSPAEAAASLRQRIASAQGRWVALPAWLQPRAEDNLYTAALRLATLQEEAALLQGELQHLSKHHGLAKAIADIQRVEWLITQIHELPTTENFIWITGWTEDLDGNRLNQALSRAHLRFLLGFPKPPPGAVAPLLLSNPRWARPFEVFSRALGMPGLNEADPSVLLAVIVPLLFGYMFGDVGQGLVLFIIGWALRGRGSWARLLMAGGLASTLFGFLFGSVFGHEDWIPALWLHPLEAPLTVLALPLFVGAGLLTLGMVLRGLEAYWRGASAQWWVGEAGMLLMYGGLWSSLFEPAGAVLVGLGMIGYLAGYIGPHLSLGRLLAGLGTAVEEGMRLAINTLSFARVGAFALAHAGLSAAIIGLAEAVPHWLLSVSVIGVGNVLVLALEGLVVSIQTTRLVLFEFFIRFLTGEGRALRPLLGPDGYSVRGVA
jgi:V/A-type H+-transporting ATPase subunit I